MLNASWRVSRPSELPAACGVTRQALRFARVDPRLSADRRLLAAAHQRRIVPLRVPFVGVARPYAVGVAHEEARLDQTVIETEVLHQHRAVREIPVAVGADGDVLSVRQSDPALFRRAVGPERRVRRVGNEAARGLRRIRRVHAAGGGELRGHALTAAACAGDAMQIAAAVHDIELAIVAFSERGDAEARFESAGHRHRGLRAIRNVPDAPGREVAEDIATDESRNCRSTVDVAARDSSPDTCGRTRRSAAADSAAPRSVRVVVGLCVPSKQRQP